VRFGPPALAARLRAPDWLKMIRLVLAA
jgi:hypothetical protein